MNNELHQVAKCSKLSQRGTRVQAPGLRREPEETGLSYIPKKSRLTRNESTKRDKFIVKFKRVRVDHWQQRVSLFCRRRRCNLKQKVV